MIGLETYEIIENKDGTRSLKLSEPEPKVEIAKNPIPPYKLRMLSPNQKRVNGGENSR